MLIIKTVLSEFGHPLPSNTNMDVPSSQGPKKSCQVFQDIEKFDIYVYDEVFHCWNFMSILVFFSLYRPFIY